MLFLHPRNIHGNGYNFRELILNYPPLAAFVTTHHHGHLSIDYADAIAVKHLNAVQGYLMK